MSEQRGSLVFNRFTREAMGLPPADAGKRRGVLWTLVKGAAIVLALFGAGWLAGEFVAAERVRRIESLPFRLQRVGRSAGPGLLASERPTAIAVADNPGALLAYAEAAMMASELAPRQAGYYGNLALVLDGVGERLAGKPLSAFRAETLHAAVLAELDRHPEAFAALVRADRALSAMPDGPMARALRLHLVNLQSYLLATAPEGKGRNPGRALHLAQAMISSRDRIGSGDYASGSAALVDTLAAAWFAVGDRTRAMEAQTLALGLAKPGDLAVYLAHYDAYARSRAAAPGLVALK
ncbi:MAG: hypothetical protein LBJ46_08535 [Planctomycetota bacterium]|nr:hypothetical protein [Planctomycetota bacterium]